MSIHRKKSAVINSQVRIRNELSQIFVPTNNNLGISINTTVPVNTTGTISTSISNIDSNAAYRIGQNWVDASNGLPVITLFSACWSPELNLFCITGNDWTNVSNNGLNWTIRYLGSSPGLQAMNSVCWSPELRLFCTVASNANYAAVSSNGTTWTVATTVPSGIWASVCWSPELRLFCAIASSGTGNNQVMVSSNGTSWSSSNVSNVVNNAWTSICWSPELRLFCAVARTGTTTQRVMVSSDGLIWSNASTGVLSNNWNSVCWAPELGLFCAVASSGTSYQRVMVSRDGLNWINPSETSGILSNNWSSVCWAREIGLFCAVSTSGGVMVSRDSLNWSIATSGVLNTNQFVSVCWSPQLSSFLSISYAYAMITNPECRISITPIAQQNNYFVPLVSSNGTQEIKTKANLSYNINNNTLQLENLSTTNLPTCSAIPTKSTDLINKAYLNSFVGDYTQGWIHEDWLNGDPSGNSNVFSWGHSYHYSGANLTSSNINVIPSESGRQGIIRLMRQNELSFTLLRPNNSIQFTSTQNVCARFLVRPFSNSTSTAYTQVRIFLAPFRGNIDYYNIAANYANMACWVFETYAVNTNTDNIKWGCFVNTNVADAYYNYGSNGNSLRNKWVLFEIELNNQKPSFYITVVGETNRTLVYQETTKIISNTVMLVPYILLAAGSVASTTSVDVDYIDIKYTNMSRR